MGSHLVKCHLKLWPTVPWGHYFAINQTKAPLSVLYFQWVMQRYDDPATDIWAGKWKKGSYGFRVCDSSNTHVQFPIWAADMHFCLKLPQGLYYMSVNSKGSSETALMHRLIWAFFYWLPMWSVPFSHVLVYIGAVPMETVSFKHTWNILFWMNICICSLLLLFWQILQWP